MRAAVLHEYGVPEAGEFDEPVAGDTQEGTGGQALVEVLAAGLNPVDVAISAGRFYAGKPPLPSVAGREGVGLLDGERVYFDGPLAPFGSMAERALIDPKSTYRVPDGVADGVAVALGISGLAAWLGLTWRAKLEPGEHVLVLAASGVLGQIAVQGAKLLGAGRVVAAARSREGLERCVELGADATVRLGDDEDLAGALGEAAEGRIDVVIDPLWGEPLVAALNAASFGARIVQIGAGAGADAVIPSAAIRGKMLVLMGHTNFAAPPQVKAEAYARMAEAAAAGELRVAVEELALEQVGEAWERLAAGSHAKLVLRP
jgi:NADPH:quinone reductase-like Zn-dependent oxidoreductase